MKKQTKTKTNKQNNNNKKQQQQNQKQQHTCCIVAHTEHIMLLIIGLWMLNVWSFVSYRKPATFLYFQLDIALTMFVVDVVFPVIEHWFGPKYKCVNGSIDVVRSWNICPSDSSLLTELDRRGYYSDNNNYFYDNYFGDQLTMMKVFVS